MYNTLIAEFDSRLRIKEYAFAYRLYELKYGSEAGRGWKAAVFGGAGAIVLYALAKEQFDFGRFPAASVIILICLYMLTYYLFLVPKKARLYGEHIYKSSRLLSKPQHCKIYRDFLEMENEYESIKRYYTEVTDCIETERAFILMGGVEKPLLVISKKQMSPQQQTAVSEHFQKEMTKRCRKRS